MHGRLRGVVQVCCLLILFPFGALAQAELSGRVVDAEDRGPLPGAMVQALDSTQAIITFTVTGADGRFKLLLPHGGHFSLCIRALGHREYRKEIAAPMHVQHYEPLGDIALSLSTEEIKAVQVSGSKPIVRRGDTLSYNVSLFAKGDEKNVEDLIRRLPGIDVSESGSISFQGKSVEKVMVEGNDLLGRGYQLLTRNFDAKAVKRVDVLEHFQEEQLLKGVQESDRVALNLSLQDGTQALAGSLEGAYGYRHAYASRVNLTFMAPHQQWMLLGNSNSMGEHPLAMSEAWLRAQGLGSMEAGQGSFFEQPGQEVLGERWEASLGSMAAPLSDRRKRQNFSHMGGLMAAIRPMPSMQLKLNGFFMQEDDHYASLLLDRYALPAQAFEQRQQGHQDIRARLGAGRAALNWNVGSAATLRYEGGYGYTANRTAAEVLLNGAAHPQQRTGSYQTTDHALVYTQGLGSHGVVQSGLAYTREWQNERYGASYPLAPPFGLVSHDTIAQTPRRITDFLGVRSVYLSPGYAGFKFQALVDATAVDAWKTVDAIARFLPDTKAFKGARLRYLNTTMGGRVTYTYEWLTTYLQANAHYLAAELNAHNGSTLDRLFRPYPELVADLQFKHKMHFADLRYNYFSSATTLEQAQPGLSLRAYRMAYSGAGELELFPAHQVTAIYTYGDWLSRYFVQMLVFYRRIPKLPRFNSDISPLRSISTFFDYGDQQDIVSAQLTSDTYITPLHSNIKCKAAFTYQRQSDVVNALPLPFEVYRYSATLAFKTTFWGPFNFELGASASATNLQGYGNAWSIDNMQYVELHFLIAKGVRLRISADRQQVNLAQERSDIYFLDAEFTYELPHDITLYAKGYNLLNWRQFTQHKLSPDLETWSRYQIAPLRAVAGIAWHF